MTFNLLLFLAPAFVVGTVSGGLTAWWLLRKAQPPEKAEPVIPPEHWLASDIDRAATAWATAHGRPEAAGLVADKLHALHHIARRRGWSRP